MKMETIYRGSAEYPNCLEDLGSSAPYVLYCRGNIQLLYKDKKIAVIGSRSVSAGGFQASYNNAYEKVKTGSVIISGLALGCDTAAHRATLDAGGYTIAVVASGLDLCHPAENIGLQEEIVEKDGLICKMPSAGCSGR